MTKLLLLLTVVVMFFLVGLVFYESYRSTQEAETEKENSGFEEISEFETSNTL